MTAPMITAAMDQVAKREEADLKAQADRLQLATLRASAFQ